MTLATNPHRPLAERTIGRVLTPGDDAWDEARQSFNLVLDQHPAVIVFPADEGDISVAVAHAREAGLQVTARATGHNSGPLGSMEDMMLIDVSALRHVSIDPAACAVRVGAGVKWESICPALSEHGLAALHGSSPDVGVAGYSLGGGIGWLGRRYGLQANAVTAFEIVTADGRLRRVDGEREPDLFWALRGGGGSFGVVAAIEFRVHPVEELYAGVLFFPFERSGEVLHTWRELLPAFPEELTTWADMLHFPDDPEVPEDLRGQSFAVLFGVYLGEEEDGRELLAPIRELGPALDTFAMVPPADLGELAMDPTEPLPLTTAHLMLRDLPAEAVEEVLSVAGPDSGTTIDAIEFRHMGGAFARTPEGAGARAAIDGEVLFIAIAGVEEPGDLPEVEATLARVVEALEPYAAEVPYFNFVEKPADASRLFDDETWARLRAVKAEYDPEDVFRGNHHVPAG